MATGAMKFPKTQEKGIGGKFGLLKTLNASLGSSPTHVVAVKDVEVSLGPLREDLKEFKAKSVSGKLD